ncbi:hypothetical protein A3K48_01500 [candidate division WOR-1 bacterium RIFOXYA12_FULL_52_29]|uniref:Uncharacterized protein n=1 Tax=candidate division WOR-1 bacterium RIFOXYC12_FULL_54_18 TaxID=1802584 RepID=A0A1F4T539_UNCSA|nr:MAG: hypothetical protein A3K44_01500 [candidate division WOR-1 bacterium RIFOXYA2_FULL_51_19]OGC17259.1 MAG: hypothetical protein A3K48_01500 [candidate division WOR-1 bacterium RIFOXYA12_FULL_52_29]OGC26119.1 MAG: hypothetical protein A3K32_01495 [candidate division WOR-1 bacterium RIFOXYB2_FULL_45_9]OGC27676.1 MAG: hypothetical protein A3K49_01500 [candidate division WOR-1 bacterium RIFOXYC12_FULL_54_18]OGC30033.1 MAG: hypothetical protein A2346_04835 [candidate division WOR-1 bacterium R
MKKLLIVSLAVLIAGLGVIGYKSAQAATSDNFTITITVAFIGISLKDYAAADYSTWAIGIVSTSSVATMESNSGSATEEGVQVVNDSNVAVDLAGYATNIAGWTLGSQGADTYILSVKGFDAWQAAPYPDMSGATSISATTSPGTSIVTNIPSGDDKYTYFSIAAPTSVTVGGANTITVTLEATLH